MARKDEIKEDGRAFEIRNITVATEFKHPDYVLKHSSSASLSQTGDWSVFCLEHPDGHWFKGRWDEKQSALDIDLFRTRKASKPYKKFQGHHTGQNPDPDIREFLVDLKLRGVGVFIGSVRFNLGRRIAFTETFDLSDPPISASAVRKSRFRTVWDYLAVCFRRCSRLFLL